MALSKLELGWKPCIPHPGDEPDREARAFYSLYFNINGINGKKGLWENKEDSPDESRTSLIKRVHSHISSLTNESFVLDLGAGRQIFEKEYENRFGKPNCAIVTLDIASLTQKHLLAEGYSHLQATGRSLPFKDNVFDAVVSNMAFDFMLPEALTELSRITRSSALIFLNMHHPSLVNYNIDDERHKLMRRIRYKKNILEQNTLQLAVYRHHKYLKDNRLLFETKDQIARFFEAAGFEIKQIEVKSDVFKSNNWWEVDLVKPKQT